MRFKACYFTLIILTAGAYAANDRAAEPWWRKLKDMAFGDREQHSANISSLSSMQITAGLKDMLEISGRYAIAGLGRYNGFAAAPDVHIPLPVDLMTARNSLARFGLESRLDDLELQMNRTAEEATPKLGDILQQSITDMDIKDPAKIVRGPENAATALFRVEAAARLRSQLRPLVEAQLRGSGAEKNLKIINHSLRKLPMGPTLKFDMADYVTGQTLAGIFTIMERKEASIRKNPGLTKNPAIEQLFGR